MQKVTIRDGLYVNVYKGDSMYRKKIPDTCWKEITKELNLPVGRIITRYKSIITSYRRYLKTHNVSYKDPFRPEWEKAKWLHVYMVLHIRYSYGLRMHKSEGNEDAAYFEVSGTPQIIV